MHKLEGLPLGVDGGLPPRSNQLTVRSVLVVLVS